MADKTFQPALVLELPCSAMHCEALATLNICDVVCAARDFASDGG
jgi:hypothetical protein